MSNQWMELLASISDNTIEYITIVLIVSFLYWILFRKYINDICDPFAFSLFSSSMATSVVVFMYSNQLIARDEYMESFVLTELFYLAGILCVPKIKKINIKIKLIPENMDLLFYSYVIIYLLTQIFIYITMGIPILSSVEHSNFYENGNGSMLFVIQSTLTPAIFCVLYKNFFCEKKKSIFSFIFYKFSLIFIVLTLFLGGSKSGLLQCVYVVYFFNVFNLNLNHDKLDFFNKLKKKFLCLAVVGVVGVLFIKIGNGDIYDIIVTLLNRFIGFGDTFAYFYGADIKNYLSISNEFYGMFGPLLARFRLINYEDIPIAFGGQLLQTYFNISDIQGGPNFRHNVFSYLYFGLYGGVIFSFFLGIIIGFVRNILSKFVMNDLGMFFIYMTIYLGVCGFGQDVPLAINTLISKLIFNVVLIFFICKCTCVFHKIRK